MIFSRPIHRAGWKAMLLAACLAAGAASLAVAAKPNIVFILADDMGWGDLSPFSCADYVTPNLDRLARNGVILTRACAWPVCSPSRAALLTGMDPKRVGVPAVLMPGATGINTNSYTIAEHLRRNGYATALIGKWHLGYSNNALPQARGFTTFFGHHGGEINYTNFFYTSGNEYDLYDGETNVAAVYQGQYTTTLFTERAAAFIESNTNRPFFLYLAYNAPHYPLYAPTNYTARFMSVPFGARRTFAAMVGALDDGVGRVLDVLEARGLSSNTMVWFMTDNGPMTNQGGVSAPFREDKNSLNEGGIRVPAIVQWPGRLAPGTTNDSLASLVDIFPTLCAAAGIPPPASLRLDGTNLLELLRGADAPPQRALCCFQDGSFQRRALVAADWKYLNTNGVPEVYAMPGDAAEATNVAGVQAALVQAFEQQLTNQWQDLARGIYFPHTNVAPVLTVGGGPR